MGEQDGRPVAGTLSGMLRDLRLAAGLSQEELAAAAGVSPRTVGSLERGQTGQPFARSLRRLADALALTGQDRAAFLAFARGPAGAPGSAGPGLGELERGERSRGTAVPGGLGRAGTAPAGQRREQAAPGGPGQAETAPGGQRRAAPGGRNQVASGGQNRAAPGGLGPGAAEPGERAAPAAPGALPRQLPAGVRNFAGRDRELAVLDTLLDQLAGPDPTMVISAIGGTAGVGKTALAVQWAHRAAEHFPDGQLYVNLRGYDPGEPVAATDALAGFLRTLGVPGQEIPADVEERAARYRSLLAGRRVLVLLDNVGSVEQARPLLPGSPGCLTLVTSRDSLAGLVAREGARRLDLDLLTAGAAAGLLRALVGERAGADPAAAAALARQCAGLPLALRVAAELAVARPTVPLANLASELADQQRRLDLLAAGGDERTAMRAVFSWSYRHLDPAAARAFRLLSLHPGADLDGWAAAALTGTEPAQAQVLLGLLARAHLILPAGPGRYGLHDLLRAYGQELAASQDGEAGPRAALTRLFGYYLGAAAAAMDILEPAGHASRPRVAGPAPVLPPLDGTAAARAWLDAQRGTLVTAAGHAAAYGWPEYAIALAGTVWRYFETGGHLAEGVVLHGHALDAARRAGDRTAEAAALTNLGLIAWWQGRNAEAARHYQTALARYRQAGDRAGAARVRLSLGLVHMRTGQLAAAIGQFRLALALYRETGDRNNEARALGNLSLVDLRRGQFATAAVHLRQALAIFRETADRNGEALVLDELGDVELRQGHYVEATGHFQRALELCRETGNRIGESDALTDLGDVARRLGRHGEAAGRYEEALALSRRIGDRNGEFEALSGLAALHLATGQPGLARKQYSAALAVAHGAGDSSAQARAHHGLARAWHAAGGAAQARQHWEQAHALYASLDAAQATEVRAELLAAAGPDAPDSTVPDSAAADSTVPGSTAAGQPEPAP